MALGPDMEKRVKGYLKEGTTKSEWIALWDEEGQIDELDRLASEIREDRGWAEDDLVVMYSGNFGLGYLFDEVLEVAGSEDPVIQGKSIRFSFHGGGKRRVELEGFLKSHPKAPLELYGYEDEKRLGAHLRSADVNLVSLNPIWDGTMVPSKLQGIFAVGRPVVFVGSKECSIGQWIKESGGGWTVAPVDAEGLRKALQQVGSEEERKKRGEAALRFSRDVFSKEINVKRYAEGFARRT